MTSSSPIPTSSATLALSQPSRPSVSSSRTQSRYIVTIANEYHDVRPSALASLYPPLTTSPSSATYEVARVPKRALDLKQRYEDGTQTVWRTRTITLPDDHEDIDTEALVQDEEALDRFIAESEAQGRVETTVSTKGGMGSFSGSRGMIHGSTKNGLVSNASMLPATNAPTPGSADTLLLYHRSTGPDVVSKSQLGSSSTSPPLTPLNVTRSPPKSLEPFGLSYAPDQSTAMPASMVASPQSKGIGTIAIPPAAVATAAASASGSRFGDIAIRDPLNLSASSLIEPAPSYDLPGAHGPGWYRLFLKVSYFSLVYGMRYFFYAVFAWFTLGFMWVILPWVLCGGVMKGAWDWAMGFGRALAGKLGQGSGWARSGYLETYTESRPVWKEEKTGHHRRESASKLVTTRPHDQQRPINDTTNNNFEGQSLRKGRRRSSNTILSEKTNGVSSSIEIDDGNAETLPAVAASRAEAFIKLDEVASVASHPITPD
ncbi:hypothetical protein I317_03333 [Kwoniella heveanensis CBS 569]|nr:hypothetical protein I317_03333 [Kwoniella heveanensis CBS 569]